MSAAVTTQAQQQQALAQQNSLARQIVLGSAVEMIQPVFSQTVSPSSQSIINVSPRYTGLIKSFLVDVTATITNTSGSAITPTDLNVSNLLSNVTLTDLNNNQRINTYGWHIEMINSIKRQRVYGSSVATDSPIKYGSNWTVISAPNSIAAGASATVVMKYEIPCAYSDGDLRGAIFAQVLNATMNLQLTINPAPVVATGDSTMAVYSGNPGSITSLTVTIYQRYLDQLPKSNGNPILPIQDLATSYELKYTSLSGIVPNQNFSIPYSNFRDFASSIVMYYNGTNRTNGTDINNFSLTTANYTQIRLVTPGIQALMTRNAIGTDLPLGFYYFSYRNRNISTAQYGNMELNINPITAGAGAYVIHATEDFALQNVVTNAGSLASS